MQRDKFTVDFKQITWVFLILWFDKHTHSHTHIHTRMHTHTHRKHREGPLDWHIHINIYEYIPAPPATCSQHLSTLQWINNSLTSKICFTRHVYNAFIFRILTLSWRRPLSYRNQSKSMDWFLYDNGLRHERVSHL